MFKKATNKKQKKKKSYFDFFISWAVGTVDVAKRASKYVDF